ncbi:MAG: cytochrome c3 family protein [Nitrospirota bacterium]
MRVRAAGALLLLGLVAAAGPLMTAYGAPGNHFYEVEQTVHNIMPPNSLYTLKELCIVCHVSGEPRLPGLPPPPEEEGALPTFLTEKEQRPIWEPSAPTKNFSLSPNWPLPQFMSPDRPFGASAGCLGCHDGTFAEDVHRGEARMEVLECVPLCGLLDRFEAALGTNPSRPRTIPDHPISTFYPRAPDGEQRAKEPVTSQRRFFSIADLQDDQLVLPTGPVSRFYVQTPGSPPAPPSVNGQAPAVSPVSGEPLAIDPAEPFRLIRTTFGVMHCDSCHNAHSELHAGFLRDKSPQLCLLCHDR